MSRTQYAPKQIYIGDGSLDTFTFDFKIESETQLLVVQVDSNLQELKRFRGNNTDEIGNINFNTMVGGGTVVLTSAPIPGTYLILLLANDAPTQPYEFSNKMSFNLKRIEMALDFILGAVQRLSYRAKQALKIHDLDNEETFDFQLPPGITDQANRTFVINEDSTGVKFGPTTQEIANAQSYAESALESATNANSSAESAAESAEEASDSEEATRFFANLFLFDFFEQVDDTDSPIDVLLENNSTLYLAIDENDNITFNLPDLSTVDENYKIAIIKNSDSENHIEVIPFEDNTVNGATSYEAYQRGIGVVLYKESETNWGAKFFAFTESTGISNLPAGGAVGAALVKKSLVDGDAEWDDLVLQGFSSRLNAYWSSNGLRDFFEKFLAFIYSPPAIASFTGSSNILREKGTVVSGITLSANITKTANPLARIRFLQGATVIEDMNPPASTGSGVRTADYNTDFSDTTQFRVEVTDTTTVEGGPTTVGQNLNYNFVYPYYYGTGLPGLSAANVATLTKDVINSNNNLRRNFTTNGSTVGYFAYPVSYGALTKIEDSNAFNVTASWERRTENITGLDGTPVSYYIYEFKNVPVAGTTYFDFIR